MPIPRRRFLHLAASATTLPLAAHIAAAQAYPTQPLRWIVGFAPGGGASIVSRIMAQWLSERLGQQVIVENRPGASTNLSIQMVANSPPDGYTLLYVASSASVNVSLFDQLPFNLTRDIAMVSGLIDFPVVMITNPSVPATTVGEFIAYAKVNPRKVNMASFGTGSSSHVAGELFKTMTSVELVHVPYRGSAPAITDLIGGQVQVMWDVMPTALPQIQAGKVRALGMAGNARFDGLPDLPTIGETVRGYEANSWAGVGVPRRTPPEIIARLNREINAGLADAAVKMRLAEVASTPSVHTPESFAAYVASEIEKWGKVVREAGIRPE